MDSQEVEEQEMEGQDFEEDHLAAKVIGQKLDEEDHFEAKVVNKEVEEQEHLESNDVVDWIRGEVIPAAPRPEQQSGGRRRSPGVQARRLARLLQNQKGLCNLHDLPPTHLQKKRGFGGKDSKIISFFFNPADACSEQGEGEGPEGRVL